MHDRFINELTYCFDKYMKPNFKVGEEWHHYIMFYPNDETQIFIRRIPGRSVSGIYLEKVDGKLIIKKISINPSYQTHYIDNFENIVNDMFIGKPVSLDKAEKLSRKEKRKQIHQLLAFAGIVSGLSGYTEESSYEKEDHSQK